jgi:hypothetical protein
MKKYTRYFLGVILAAFALLTLFLSGSVIFDLFEIRAKEGNYVLLIVWVNFISSFLYLFASYGFFTNKKWTVKPLGLAMVILILGIIGLYFYINSGGIYEEKTPKAMLFRMSITLLFMLVSYFGISKKQLPK